MVELTSDSSSQHDTLFTIKRDGSVSENLPIISSNSSNIETSSPEDISNQQTVILCLLCYNCKLGAAYYNVSDKQLYMYNDMIDLQPTFMITRSLISQLNPIYILTKGSINDDFVKCLIDVHSSGESTVDSARVRRLPDHVYLLGKEFTLIACEYKLMGFRLSTEPTTTESEHEFFLQSLVDFKNKQSLFALGALIMYLERNWGSLSSQYGELIYLHLNSVSMDKHMFIDKNTFEALHVFKPAKHDSSFKHGGDENVKEGLSLYKLITQHCRSVLGILTAKNLLANPINNIDELQERHEFIDFVNKPNNVGFIESLHQSIGKLYDVTRPLIRVSNSRATSYDWVNIYRTIYHTLFIHEICRPYKGKCAILTKLVDSVTLNLYGLENCINNAIDLVGSEKNLRPVIKFGLDEELDAKKLKRKDIRNTVTAAANFAVNQLPDNINECVVVYVPETGYLVAIKEWAPKCDRFELESKGFQFLFELRGMLHYKNAMCKELDLQFGDIHLDIIAHENRIIQRLCAYVIRHNMAIKNPLKIIGLIDCLISMALVSKDNAYVRPKLNADNIHEIIDCKHPLMADFCNNIVPNSFFSSGSHSHIKIITGPNASGKSVFLRQVGIIIFLAHIGMYVPVKEANIGMTYSMHTRIHSSESACIPLSAFMMDLAQMSQALHCAQPSSLIMIDEFGRGTTGPESICLLAGALHKFALQEKCCPHVIVSTHIQQLLDLLPESQYISHAKMEYTKDGNEIIFLYKLVPGVSDSYGIDVSNEAGVHKDIVNRAKEMTEAIKNNIALKPLPQNNEKYNIEPEDINLFLAQIDLPEINK